VTPLAVGVAVTCGFLCGLAVWAVAGRPRRRQRRLQRENAVRSVLFRTLDEPVPSAAILGELRRSDNKLLEAKARAMLPALRGSDRESLAQLLEARGATTSARQRCHSHRPTVRITACQLLGDLGSSFAVLDLVPLLDDHRPEVREAAARALGRLGQPAGATALLGAVEGRHPIPVDVVADAIQQIRDWPLSALHPCLTHPSASTRALAVELLGRVQNLEHLPELVDLLQHDPATEVRVRAARALGRIGSPRAIEPLLACVPSGPAALVAEAVTALGRLGATAAVPTLRVTLLGPSPALVKTAVAALAAIEPQGIELVQEIAADQYHPACTAARAELVRLQALSRARAHTGGDTDSSTGR
jgi:HEAT repeat protein